MPQAKRAPSSSARVVYAGIVASTLIVSLGALVVSMSLKSLTTRIGLGDLAALLVGFGAFAAVVRRLQRLGGRRTGQSRESWWGENAGRMVLVWGLWELGALAGAALVFATGHYPIFTVLALAALAGLATSSPGRLAAE